MNETTGQDSLAGTVAIIGMAGRFPGARNPGELWKLLREGREATYWASDEELREAGVAEHELGDPNYVRATLPLPGMEMFDAGFFGFSKREAAVLDPQHRHFLECCWEALEDAGHPPERFGGSIGVFGGCGMQAYMALNLLSNPQLLQSMGLFLLRHTGNDKDFLTTRVSYLLDLKGPSVGIQTACSTSLVAVHVAAQNLLSGECDMALAGGSSIELPHRRGYRHAEGEILSPDGHCRAFDDEASGTLFGSGTGVVVLRRTEDALRDGDHIYAVIRGSAINNDGSGKAGYLAPSVDGQAAAAVEALAVAGIDPASVSYVEAHGTGTPVGDPIEVAALTQAYGDAGPGAVGIGSLKTNIGHLDTAAGVASLIKVCLALRHGLLPASLNFRRANSRFDLARMPFRVLGQPQPWPRGSQPRRAGVNSLGVGGTNAHVVVEEPPQVLRAGRTEGGWQLFTLSARTESSLKALQARWQQMLEDPPPDFDLADAAYTTQEGRRVFPQRLSVVARDLAGLRQALAQPAGPRGPASRARAADAPPPVVFLFPGGGAHFPGAGRDLMVHEAFRQAVQECLAQLPADAPADLGERLFEGRPGDAADAAWLEAPSRAIPALFILEYALARLWQSWGVQPAAMIGHSAGEYAAACIAGMLSLRDALAIVVLRGRLFEQAPAGGMLSIDLPEPQLRPLCDEFRLDLAAVNAPDLCLASGSRDGIARLHERLVAQGLEPRRLHIDVAAHSRLLDGILEPFRQGLAGVSTQEPSVPLLSTLTGEWLRPGQPLPPDYWARHLRDPVRFAEGMQRLLRELPGAVLLEVGPGQGLGSLARHNGAAAGQAVLASTRKAGDGDSDAAVLLASAGALWARGGTLDLAALRGPGECRRVPLPTYAFDHERHWIEPGRGLAAEPAPDAAVRPIVRLGAMEDWFQAVGWQPAPVDPAGDLPPGRWLVLGSELPLGQELLATLSARGASAVAVEQGSGLVRLDTLRWRLPFDDGPGFVALLEQLEREGLLPDRIVHLGALGAAGRGHEAALPGAFDAPVLLAKALTELDIGKPLQMLLVTAGSQGVDGGAPRAPQQALALGPCRVIPRELAQLTCRLVDLDPAQPGGARVIAQLLAEAAAGGGDLAAWRDGTRWQPHRQRAPRPAADARRLRPRGVYLVTGGLGGIGMELALFLARSVQARLMLVSRRTLPPPQRWAAIAADPAARADGATVGRLLQLQAEGAEVQVMQADASDRVGMAAAVQACRERWGALNGVFHAAGELGDAPLAAKPLADMHRLIASKAGGAAVLDELLPAGSLDIFAVFSSTSVELGPPGQVDYVAANAMLDAIALARPDGLAIRWGVWADTGMAVRAFGQPAAAAPGPVVHPLLGSRADEAGEVVFDAVYDPASLWVLNEHRVSGQPVLPGTAYVEIARAAMAVVNPGAPVEVRSLSFEKAMVFDAGTRRVQVRLRPEGDSHAFLVRSRAPGDAGWTEHARATVGPDTGQLLPARAPAGPWQPARAAQARSAALEFGPRWDNLDRMRLAQRSAVALLALPAGYEADLSQWGCHPALLDMAATFGLHVVDESLREGRLFVPVSVDRIRLSTALPARFASRVELRGQPGHGLVLFDVALHDEAGRPLATLEGLTMRAIDPAALSAVRPVATRTPSTAETLLACGIRMQDAPAVFARLLDTPGPLVTVSSVDLGAVLRRLAPAQRALPAAGTAAATLGEAAPAAGGGAGLTPLEEALAQVWRELLGVDQVGRYDDFFALGGHSLVAVRLFARIRKQYGADLPLATLFEAATLSRLAERVAETATCGLPEMPAPAARADEAPGSGEAATAGADGRPASNVIPLGKRAWSPLVQICAGEPGRRPLFCVHGAGGNVLNFKLIADRVGTDQPFYGLQAQGVDGRLPPLQSVEAMATQYIEALRSAAPAGPYRLAGYSAGGLIALEMAQQLRAAGEKVEMLLMIDTLSPEAARTPVPLWRKLWLMRKWSLAFTLDWPARRRRGREIELRYTQALEQLARGEPLPPELVDFHLFRNFLAAQSRYEPQPYEGDVTLFKARECETQYLQAGRCLGWERHVRGHIEVTTVDGSHFSMMNEPGLSQLARGMRAVLDEADGRARPSPDNGQAAGGVRGWLKRLAR